MIKSKIIRFFLVGLISPCLFHGTSDANPKKSGGKKMIIVFRHDATDDQINHIIDKVKALGLDVNVSKGKERTVVGVLGDEDKIREQPLESFPGPAWSLPTMK